MKNPNISQIILSLESETLEDREAAAEQLRELGKCGTTLEDRLTALRAAARDYPPRRYDFRDSAVDLIRVARSQPEREYIPIIAELYPVYSRQVKEEALTLLAQLDDRDAAIAWMGIIRSYAREGSVPRLNILSLQSRPRHPDVFFPELLEYADIETLSYEVYLLCLTYFEKRLLSVGALTGYSEQVLCDYRACTGDLGRSQRSEGIAWMWDENYRVWRDRAGLLLDLLGYFPALEVKEALRKALDNRDPKLKCFAILSLLRLGEQVDQVHMGDVARSAEMRNHLHDELQKMDRVSMFPEEYATQEAFAESDMVNWLVFPTELGRVPEEIELMKVVSVDTATEDGFLDYYVFRFRTHEPHWAAKDGWVAGISGPFLRRDAPSTNSSGETFSSFESWESKTPEEHVGDIQEMLERWREYHSQ